jgi:F-type H+-transporting ATPase subunit delta
MRATSQASLGAASDRWEPVLTSAGAAALGFAEQLFEVEDLVGSQVALRRALTDPSRSGADKAVLAERVLHGAVADEVIELVEGLARDRWSAAEDLGEAIESLALDSALAAAQAVGRLETVEEELFRVDRLLARQRDVRMALSNQEVPAEHRLALADELFGARVAPETALFVRRAVLSREQRTLTSSLAAASRRAAVRRRRLTATVVAASPLTRAQVERLEGILRRAYGRPVAVNLALDETVVGGLRIQVGSQVVDATLLARMDEARHRLAG